MFKLHSSLTNLIANTCLIAISLVLSFLFCEVIVRVFFPEPMNPRFVRDTGFGIRDNQPNIRTHHSSPGEYQVAISTNSDGLRGTNEYNLTTPAGTRRVAILGDSFAFGYGCNDDQVVSAVLNKSLNDRRVGGSKWEVLNFGVSGYGQSEELMLYRKKTRQYRPDFVALLYFENDIGNNVVADTFALDRDGRIEPTGKRYLPGVAARQWMYAIPPVRWLFVYSQAWNLLRNRLSGLVQQHLLHKVGLKTYNEGTAYGIALTRSLLLQLQGEVESDGAKFIVMIIPDTNTITSNFPFTRVEWQTRGMAVADGRDFIDRNDYYARDGHWKPLAHRKAAQVLTSMIGEDVALLGSSLEK
jgi:hypothetical protein